MYRFGDYRLGHTLTKNYQNKVQKRRADPRVRRTFVAPSRQRPEEVSFVGAMDELANMPPTIIQAMDAMAEKMRTLGVQFLETFSFGYHLLPPSANYTRLPPRLQRRLRNLALWYDPLMKRARGTREGRDE